MPELPEVETVVRFIRPLVEKKRVEKVVPQPGFEKVLETHEPRDFNRHLRGQRIHHVRRRGKFIVMDLARGVLLVHLRMTGRLLRKLSTDDNPKHVTAEIFFADGSRLFFKDYRKFGRLYYYDQNVEWDRQLGVEPLSDEFTQDYLFQQLHARSRAIKPLLLDQSILAGLGNIYVDETLWEVRIHPLTVSNRVSRIKSNRLWTAIRSQLQASIDLQGTTIINFYFGEKSEGNFRSQLQVFGREGEPCPRCDSRIKKIWVAQRGTHICRQCQRVRR